MSTCRERIVTITAHYSEPVYEKVVSIPGHLSLDEARKVIHSAIVEHIEDARGALPLEVPDLSSIIIASGEFT
jgi:hypothetical protein